MNMQHPKPIDFQDLAPEAKAAFTNWSKRYSFDLTMAKSGTFYASSRTYAAAASWAAALEWRDAQRVYATAPTMPADPMDWPLPCDVTVGSGTIKRGVSLRTLVMRMKVLHSMAMNAYPQSANFCVNPWGADGLPPKELNFLRRQA